MWDHVTRAKDSEKSIESTPRSTSAGGHATPSFSAFNAVIKSSFSGTSSAEVSPSKPNLEKILRQPVNFRDVVITTTQSSISGGLNSPTKSVEIDLHASTSVGNLAEVDSLGSLYSEQPQYASVQRSKMVIIMVGLPGRGKTFVCNKLKCYLNWLGHVTGHFNVGNYRRNQKLGDLTQDASFFCHTNGAGLELRQKALDSALDDMMRWLNTGSGQVAIFDATNTTASRRQLLRDKLHGRCQYLFIESICNDMETLERNYMNKLMYSPDYAGVNVEEALRDFKARIQAYEDVYEPITDRSFHYIKLIDMVTGRGYMDINRISGYIPGKLVFFLMQVCRAGLGNARKIWLTRHGESEYNVLKLIGGDSNISGEGEKYATALPKVLEARLPQGEATPLQVWTSTLKRTIQTAQHLPFAKLRWKALDEIDAGVCDGMTYEDIAEKMPEEFAARKSDKLGYRYPSGESYMDVIQRLEPVIIEIERQKDSVCIVAHQAILRVIYGYFMAVSPEEIPRLSIPLHTLIELTPMPDGQMSVQMLPVDINADPSTLLENLASNPSPLPVLAS
ncbi:hypothetical protein CEUSTIGMA_g10167.t1 [Chlamydomonas eustigma]|uniref:6-phosphofructo-2-kinase domain-containing protein n=1 Tax=Chlamydomonas eustigma TaxID=1157962 RepID=A0A250XI35_9CHLO|nr:hypothetical protein CEUSTIGMA_g10167.t1 [Chlamydomonas eustigma]|eukprot:GAX82741.1 hypothetical protein CEUSTIGMA_g10167.t1 [Chlamydomonas eustigma]